MVTEQLNVVARAVLSLLSYKHPFCVSSRKYIDKGYIKFSVFMAQTSFICGNRKLILFELYPLPILHSAESIFIVDNGYAELFFQLIC